MRLPRLNISSTSRLTTHNPPSYFRVDKTKVINPFFEANGPPSLLYVYEVPYDKAKDGSYAPTGTKMTLHRLGPNEPVVSKLVYFVRVNPKGVFEKTIEQDVISGEISGTALQNFRAIISELYLPIIQESQQWGKLGGPDGPGIKEFIGTATKFGAMLTEALATVRSATVTLSLSCSEFNQMMMMMMLLTFVFAL